MAIFPIYNNPKRHNSTSMRYIENPINSFIIQCMDISSKIEAVLFFKSEPVSLKWLTNNLSHSQEEIEMGIKNLKERLQNRGLRVLEYDNRFSMGTAPEASDFIDNIAKEELKRDLGKAGLETLSTIIYKSPISKASIDYIRGVNSDYILRNLMIRNLIEKIQDKDDKRKFLYIPSLNLLNFLGLDNLEKLPNYLENKKKIEELLNSENQDGE